MRKFMIGLLAIFAFIEIPAQAAQQSTSTGASSSQADKGCVCSGSKMCVGRRGGVYCIAPDGKKRYQKK